MGCTRIRVPGANVHVYEVARSSTFYNCVLVDDPNSFRIDTVQRVFSRRRLPFSVKIPSLSSYAKVGEALHASGYSLLPPWNLMRHVKTLRERSPEIDVAIVPPRQLNEWIAASNISDLPQASRRAMVELLKRASRTSHMQFLLGHFRNKPAGVGALFAKGRIASIHLMATLPEFRRRRVATTIVLHALTLRSSIDFTWLRTRKGGIGEKVYTKLGFSSVTNILSYTATPDAEDGINIKTFGDRNGAFAA